MINRHIVKIDSETPVLTGRKTIIPSSLFDHIFLRDASHACDTQPLYSLVSRLYIHARLCLGGDLAPIYCFSAPTYCHPLVQTRAYIILVFLPRIQSYTMELDIELRPPSGELAIQRNSATDPENRENIHENEPDNFTLLNIRLEKAQYGQYSGQAACLLVFRFLFKFRAGSARIKKFHIRITFRKLPSDGSSAEPPLRVMSIAPEDLYGDLFAEERSRTASIGTTIDQSSTFTGNLSFNSSITRKHQLKLSGWVTGAEGASDNTVVWDCAETKKKASGVVPRYLGAVIVRCDGRFSAEFTVDGEQGFLGSSGVFDWRSVFGKKKKDDLVLFDPQKPFGDPIVGVADFKDLDLLEVVKLPPIQVLPPGYS